MKNSISKEAADAIMDFAVFLYVQAYLDDNKFPNKQEALTFARTEFKEYCKVNNIEYVEM